MTTLETKTRLVALSDSKLELKDKEDDIRGHAVRDSKDEEIGKVKDLLVDEDERRVRLIKIESGGFLGLGATEIVIPVDAITVVEEDVVRIDQTREHIAGAPRYDPALADQRYWSDVYRYYGHMPYWGAGYVYPPYVRRSRRHRP